MIFALRDSPSPLNLYDAILNLFSLFTEYFNVEFLWTVMPFNKILSGLSLSVFDARFVYAHFFEDVCVAYLER